MNYKKIFLYFIIFVIIFALGGVTGSFIIMNKIKIEKDKILSDCWDNARKELVGTCRPPANIDENAAVTNFYGKLLEIKSDLKQIVIDPAPLGDGEDKISSLILKITPDTQIEQVIRKDDIEYQKELEEFNQKFESDKNIIYPLQYANKPVDINAFKAGQVVTITSKEDVRNSEQLEALKIVINYE